MSPLPGVFNRESIRKERSRRGLRFLVQGRISLLTFAVSQAHRLIDTACLLRGDFSTRPTKEGRGARASWERPVPRTEGGDN